MSKSLPKQFINSAQKCGYDIRLMKNSSLPHLYVETNKILSSQKTPGLIMETKELKNGVAIKMIVKKGVEIKKPIFLCFGILKEQGQQIILVETILQEKAKAEIFAHCTFPSAKKVLHQMKAKIKLEKNSQLTYREKHYHGENFGTKVLPNFTVLLAENAVLNNEFVLKQGSIGELKIKIEAELEKNAFCDLTTKVIGKGMKDNLEIYDKIILAGENSRSLIKIRAAAVNGGKIFGQGETIALAKGNRGHIDCQEIVIGKNSLARAVPIVYVKHPQARVTHEASVGKINQKELETLMTRGLSEKQATDLIIRGVIQ